MASIPPIRKLLICGASARAAAWSSRTAGFDVVAADLFADTDLCELARVYRIPAAQYPHAFADTARKIIAREPIDAWLYTGGLENHPTVIDEISEVLPLLGNGRAALQVVRDPIRMAERFIAAGLPCPRSALAVDGLSTDKRWLVKPRASAGGYGVQFVDRSRATFNEAGCPDVSHVYQEFIDGPTYAGVFLGNSTQAQLLGVTRLWTGRDLKAGLSEGQDWRRRGFQYLGSTGPIDVAEGVAKQWSQIGDLVTRTGGLVGLFGIDAVVAPRGDEPLVYPLEVNPRYTASVEILERAFGHSLMGQHVAACGAEGRKENASQVVPSASPRQYWGKRILFADRQSVYDHALAARLSLRPPEATAWHLADTPAIDTTIRPHAPLLTMIAAGDSLAAVEKSLGFSGS